MSSQFSSSFVTICFIFPGDICISFFQKTIRNAKKQTINKKTKQENPSKSSKNPLKFPEINNKSYQNIFLNRYTSFFHHRDLLS